MEDLIKTFPTLLRAIGDEPDVREAAALAAWKRAAGEGLREHAVPTKLVEGTLVVAVADAVWQKQLGAMKAELIYRTNSILGQPVVRDVDLVLDPKVARTSQQKGDRKEVPDNEVPLELWTAANAISDKQLRQKFVRAATRAIQRRERTED